MKNESSRLQALAEYELIDTPPDQTLDDITELAAHVCDAPMSLITLVTADRQWFKSRFGLEMIETAREFAFCAYALARPDEMLVVTDATQDLRFAENPLVTKHPGVRFYAGWPLVTTGGHVLGTLCVLDRKPRILEPFQVKALQALRRYVMSEFELRRALRSFAAANVAPRPTGVPHAEEVFESIEAAQGLVRRLREEPGLDASDRAAALALASRALDRAQQALESLLQPSEAAEAGARAAGATGRAG